MDKEFREGHYKDKYGSWQADRRKSNDRRGGVNADSLNHERRKMFRRKADRELLNRDHKAMIAEALEDFAEEHGGHL